METQNLSTRNVLKDNEKNLRTLRVQTFQRVFASYPDFVMAFTKHTELRVPGDPTILFYPGMTDNQRNSVALVVYAQFLTRLIKTRCAGAGDSMEKFAFETVGRYVEFRKHMLGGMDLAAPVKHGLAMNEIETELASTVFYCLAEEVKIDAKRVDEFEFWQDFFMGMRKVQKIDHPIWTVAHRRIILNHMGDFKVALDNQ